MSLQIGPKQPASLNKKIITTTTILSENLVATIVGAAIGAAGGSIVTPYFSEWLRQRNEKSVSRQKVGKYLTPFQGYIELLQRSLEKLLFLRQQQGGVRTDERDITVKEIIYPMVAMLSYNEIFKLENIYSTTKKFNSDLSSELQKIDDISRMFYLKGKFAHIERKLLATSHIDDSKSENTLDISKLGAIYNSQVPATPEILSII